MFDIRLLSSSEKGPTGERLGAITIGDFRERFACYDVCDIVVEDFPNQWKRNLSALVLDGSKVALFHDPRFAWIVYRDGQLCFVQQMFFATGSFDEIPNRETITENGERISEWPVSLQSVIEFLAY